MVIDGWDSSRQASLALQGVAVLAVAAAAFAAQPGEGGTAGELAALAVAGLVAAFHRPFGQRGAAAGAVAWPLIAAGWGAAAAGAAGAATVLAADGARALLARRRPLGPPANWLPWATAAAAARVALAVVAASLAADLATSLAAGAAGALRPIAAGTAAYLLITLLATAGERAWRRAGRSFSWRLAVPPRLLAPRVVEAAAWALGALLVAAPRAVALGAVLAVAVLAAEAARQSAAAAALADRLGELGRVHGAGQRMVGGSSELGSVVERIHAECANVIPFHWFQLEMLAGDDEEPQTWSAGPDGVLAAGPPRPEPHPPMLPGIHRRSEWRVEERLLAGPDGAVARLTLWCDPRRLEAQDLTLFEALLSQMATSIRQALLDREAREDRLTGAAVRRVLEKRLFDAFRRAVDEGSSLAVVMVDVDRFKPINDLYGHATGDRALAAVGAVLAQHKRAPDLLARYGGEEFTLLLEDADGATALAVAERLRRAVAEIDLEPDGVALPLTVSAGVAAFPELHVKTPSELLLLADGALYEAKNRGRNRCLLDLGRARYRTPDGEVVASEERGAEPPPPRIFA